MNYHGKSAIVTGGAKGLGKIFTENLLTQGMAVVFCDIIEDVGTSTQKELADRYGSDKIVFIHGDVTVEDTIESIFTAAKELGTLHIVVNNAAAGGAFVPPKIGFTTNTMAPIMISERARKEMRKDEGGEGGLIINIGSVVGLQYLRGASVYRATKAGLHMYTKSAGNMIPEIEGVRMVCLVVTMALTDLTIWYKEQEEAGNQGIIEFLNSVKGWVKTEELLKIFSRIIEDDKITSGTTLEISGNGTYTIEHSFTEVPFL